MHSSKERRNFLGFPLEIHVFLARVYFLAVTRLKRKKVKSRESSKVTETNWKIKSRCSLNHRGILLFLRVSLTFSNICKKNIVSESVYTSSNKFNGVREAPCINSRASYSSNSRRGIPSSGAFTNRLEMNLQCYVS